MIQRPTTRLVRRSSILAASFLAVVGICLADLAWAHGVTGKDGSFLQNVHGAAVGPFLYLGAKHMVTGYDHLLFLVGVVFFLRRLKDIIQYVTLFTIGHSTTLLIGVLGGVRVNPFLIDAVIGLSVVYMAFCNMEGFKSLFGFQFNNYLTVLIFGLFHGFGLATKLQEYALPKDGLIVNILSFNVGIELGQVIALSLVLIVLTYWRTQASFARYAFATNSILMMCGFLLVGYQLSGYCLAAHT